MVGWGGVTLAFFQNSKIAASKGYITDFMRFFVAFDIAAVAL